MNILHNFNVLAPTPSICKSNPDFRPTPNFGFSQIFLDLHLSISNGFGLFQKNDKRDDFDLDIVNFPFELA